MSPTLPLVALLACHPTVVDPDAPSAARPVGEATYTVGISGGAPSGAPSVGAASPAPAVSAAVVPAPPSPPEAPPEQVAAAARIVLRTVVDAQPYRRTTSLPITVDGQTGTATLVDLAPTEHVWLLLTLALDGAPAQTYHLENIGRAPVRLSADGLTLTVAGRDRPCRLWYGELPAARASATTYAPLCDGALALRNPTAGHRTTLEWTTDFLRDHVWGGEAITTAVKELLREDAEPAEISAGGGAASVTRAGPVPARLDPAQPGARIDRKDLGLTIDAAPGPLVPGAWYPVHATPGVYAGVVNARAIDPAVIAGLGAKASPLLPAETGAPVYSIAFDLSAFELGFELGTDHPRVGWSGRVPATSRDATLPGPDGFADLAPLVRTGMLNPALQERTVSLFVGGFKRVHGAFSRGELAATNGGSHYGFVEHGVVLSRLLPGLATFVVWDDGTVDLRTWTDADPTWRVRHARQNGVPILEPDPVTGEVVPGAFIRSWGLGNWSGSAEGELSTIRGGVCLQRGPAGDVLVYSYFAEATPSAMAAVYAAYGCRYAMLLDMNALEHTYLSVLVPDHGQVHVEQLVRGMEVLDQVKGGATFPRFVGFADNRDFFYVLRKEDAR